VSNEYYDDPYMMGMEGEYTVVDYTQPTPSDYNSPNTDKSVAIVDQSPKYTIEETSIFVETITPPQFLGRDQQIEVLNLIEAGEIVSIELVTDNPYIALYIEMDDFKYKTPNGMTAAELLLRGRDEYAERHFYVEGPRPDGMYVVKFHPRTDYKYHDRLKILVRNDITRPTKFRGREFSYFSRASLPTPVKMGFNGGSILRVPNASAILNRDSTDILTPMIAKGVGVEEIRSAVVNDQFRIAPLTLAGAEHPFVGHAGKVAHIPQSLGVSALRVKWAPPGTAATSTTVDDSALLTTPFPGSPGVDGGTPSHSSQQFIVYTDATENEAGNLSPDLELAFTSFVTSKNNAWPFYFKIGDGVYYPGEVIGVHVYDIAQSKFVESVGYDALNNGAVLVTVSPGFDITPPKIDAGVESQDGFGYLYLPEMTYEAIVQEVNVKRKKKRTLN
jgi:hypothetical protein